MSALGPKRTVAAPLVRRRGLRAGWGEAVFPVAPFPPRFAGGLPPPDPAQHDFALMVKTPGPLLRAFPGRRLTAGAI